MLRNYQKRYQTPRMAEKKGFLIYIILRNKQAIIRPTVAFLTLLLTKGALLRNLENTFEGEASKCVIL